ISLHGPSGLLPISARPRLRDWRGIPRVRRAMGSSNRKKLDSTIERKGGNAWNKQQKLAQMVFETPGSKRKSRPAFLFFPGPAVCSFKNPYTPRRTLIESASDLRYSKWVLAEGRKVGSFPVLAESNTGIHTSNIKI